MSKRVTRSSNPADKKAAKIGKHLGSEKEEVAVLGKIHIYEDLQGVSTNLDFRFKFEKKSDVELDMINLSVFIREQPDWTNDIKDKMKLSKLVQEFGTFKNPSSTRSTVKSVVDKLTRYLIIKEEGSNIDLGACDGTWQSGGLIDSTLRDQLLTNVRILEASIDKKHMDWNDEKNQVWNLLSPSMYSFVAERTKVLKYVPSVQEEESREGLIHFHTDGYFLRPKQAANIIVSVRFNSDFPEKFQWLPSEFKIGQDNSVRITSYINNLHPEVHFGLYSVIEKIFQKFIPLFEKVLNDLQDEAVKRTKGIEIPEEIPEFKLAGKTLQVITKFTNILLRGRKATYPGGTFHTEGTSTERIVATGIYYYDCENITEPRLEFQEQRLSYWRNAIQDQKVGSIVTKEGRCVAFPNHLGHRVTPFELRDSIQSGHRKILAFFLVNPNGRRVISTHHVPPQQKSWFDQEVMKGRIVFPREIVDDLDWPIGFEEAKRNRNELIKERKPKPEPKIVRRPQQFVFQRRNLCD